MTKITEEMVKAAVTAFNKGSWKKTRSTSYNIKLVLEAALAAQPKGVEMWAVKGPNGQYRSLETTAKLSKTLFCRSVGESTAFKTVDEHWPRWELQGYTCVKVEVREVKV